VIIPDVNLLLYATIDAFPQHEKALQWWDQAINSDELIGLADPAVFGFLRISINPRLIKPPLSIDEAAGTVESWLAQPNVSWAAPGPGHLSRAFGFLRAAGTAGNLTTGARLAAIAVERDAAICSTDSDFARFDDVRWVNPLTAA
jgi:toxin-antitoxin system PIN domain toxin